MSFSSFLSGLGESVLSLAGPTPSASPSPSGGLDPQLAALMAGSGIDPNLLLAPPTSEAPQLSLPELLAQTSMAVSGRQGMTGQTFSGALPPWAQGLPQAATQNDDFDPYLGIVSQEGDERVYMGNHQVTTVSSEGNKFSADTGAPAPSATTTTTTQPKTMTVVQAMNLPYTWDEDEVAKAMQRLKAAGLPVDSFDMGSNSLVSIWGALVNRAATTYSLTEGKREVTPWDVLDMYKSEAQAAGTYVDPNRTETTVSRNITEISEGEAWSHIQTTLSQMLGRDPSDQETRDFTYRMNQMAASNPSISKAITRYKNGDAVSQTTRTDPGFTAADMAHEAYDDAQNDPGYGEYQAASTYFNAALSALGPIGG